MNKIKLLKYSNLFKFRRGITHGGSFHADDVFSVALLKMLNPTIEIERVFKAPETVPEDTIIFDIGGGKYDHHQMDAEIRPWGIKYAAFGLLWRSLKLGEFGKIAYQRDVYELIERDLVEPVDAYDNGQNGSCEGPYLSVSQAISWMNPNWDDEDPNAINIAFTKAVEFAAQILEIAISGAISKVKAKGIVNDAIIKAHDGYMVLQTFAPWQDWLFENEKSKEIYYCIYPSNRGGYNVQAAPTNLGSRELKKAFPEKWRGLPKNELDKLKLGLTFVHPNGFLACTDSLENAELVAKASMQA